MKFGRSIPLLLFFGLLLPTFINAKPKECAAGEKCYWNGQTSGFIPGMETKQCDDGMCYAFKCIHADGVIMHKYGCYEDFVNACGFIRSSIMENAKKDKKFRYNDESVIVVSCGDEFTDLSTCAVHELLRYADMDKNAAFGLKHKKTSDPFKKCYYVSKGIPPSQPQVQCHKGGQCLTGRTETPLPDVVFSNVTCDACAMFLCNVNGKIITGHGCLNDFERICTNIPAAEMQKIKAGKNLYNYIDENNIVSSCAVVDYCSSDEFKYFLPTVDDKEYDKIAAPILAGKGELCPYDPPQPIESKDNGSNGFKLSGMFALGLILFYLW